VLIDIAITDVIDIIFMTIVIYFVLISFKRSQAAFVLTGMVIIAAIYLIAQQFNLTLTAGMFRWFFAVILFAWVVIFQDEIRRMFEQVALWSFHRRFRQRRLAKLISEDVATLSRTIIDLSKEKIGALIVLPGKSLILGYINGGTELNGQLSEPLIKSIFDPHSIGHDGAVIVEGNTVKQFGVHLPLSKNIRKLKRGGTRHAAALGLSELSDALCLVVSEERGTISAVRNGDIREAGDFDTLCGIIERFYHEIKPKKERRSWLDFMRTNYREKALAAGLALLFWFVHVYGSKMVYKTFTIPIDYAQPIEDKYSIEVEPKVVEVTFSGPHRALYLVRKNEIRLFLKKLDLKPGAHTVRISGTNMAFPKDISLENIDPDKITVNIKKNQDEGEQ